LRLCPANPGNPRRNIEGESPLQERTYSLRVQRPLGVAAPAAIFDTKLDRALPNLLGRGARGTPALTAALQVVRNQNVSKNVI
jgi:hypothetical protein